METKTKKKTIDFLSNLFFFLGTEIFVRISFHFKFNNRQKNKTKNNKLKHKQRNIITINC